MKVFNIIKSGRNESIFTFEDNLIAAGERKIEQSAIVTTNPSLPQGIQVPQKRPCRCHVVGCCFHRIHPGFPPSLLSWKECPFSILVDLYPFSVRLASLLPNLWQPTMRTGGKKKKKKNETYLLAIGGCCSSMVLDRALWSVVHVVGAWSRWKMKKKREREIYAHVYTKEESALFVCPRSRPDKRKKRVTFLFSNNS